jgi:hypothetical protein
MFIKVINPICFGRWERKPTLAVLMRCKCKLATVPNSTTRQKAISNCRCLASDIPNPSTVTVQLTTLAALARGKKNPLSTVWEAV